MSIRIAGPPPVLPLRTSPVRFAIGDPNGISSNSWWLDVRRSGDIYLGCRDSPQFKASLPASGRWRTGYTEEAVKKVPDLVPSQSNRAWSVWDEPPETLPETVIAFRMYFLPSEFVEWAATTARGLSQAASGLRPPPGARLVVFGDHVNGSRHLVDMKYVVPKDATPRAAG